MTINKKIMTMLILVMAVGTISMTYAATTFFGEDCSKFNQAFNQKACSDINALYSGLELLEVNEEYRAITFFIYPLEQTCITGASVDVTRIAFLGIDREYVYWNENPALNDAETSAFSYDGTSPVGVVVSGETDGETFKVTLMTLYDLGCGSHVYTIEGECNLMWQPGTEEEMINMPFNVTATKPLYSGSLFEPTVQSIDVVASTGLIFASTCS